VAIYEVLSQCLSDVAHTSSVHTVLAAIEIFVDGCKKSIFQLRCRGIQKHMTYAKQLIVAW